MRKCPSCKTRMSETASFCLGCGWNEANELSERENAALRLEHAEVKASIEKAWAENAALKAELETVMAGKYCLCSTCREHRITWPKGEAASIPSRVEELEKALRQIKWAINAKDALDYPDRSASVREALAILDAGKVTA